MDRVPQIITVGPARLHMLRPVADPNAQRQISDNDRSLVSLIELAGTRVLLCSDIERFAQRQILRLHPGLKAGVVVAPHHGSMTTLDPRVPSKT